MVSGKRPSNQTAPEQRVLADFFTLAKKKSKAMTSEQRRAANAAKRKAEEIERKNQEADDEIECAAERKAGGELPPMLLGAAKAEAIAQDITERFAQVAEPASCREAIYTDVRYARSRQHTFWHCFCIARTICALTSQCTCRLGGS